MKYEALKVEIVRIDEEDILTLSNLKDSEGKKHSWDDLWEGFDFV